MLNIVVLLPYLATSAPSSFDRNDYKALLYNIHSSNKNSKEVLDLIGSEEPDFLVLQEVTARWMDELAPLDQDYPFRITHPREDNFGIAFWSKLPLARKRILFLGEAHVPTIQATIETTPSTLTLVATHPVPPVSPRMFRMRNEQLRLVAERITSLPTPALLLGDLNATPWSSAIRDFEERSGLRNSMRGFGIQTTWPAGSALLRLPLDHCLHPPASKFSTAGPVRAESPTTCRSSCAFDCQDQHRRGGKERLWETLVKPSF